MSNAFKISQCIKPLHQFPTKTPFFKLPISFGLHSQKLDLITGRAVASYSEEAEKVGPHFHNQPMSIQLEPILSEDQFDSVIHQDPVIIVWVANWCRKFVYLKPKLEKLAAHYHPSIRFYSVDVNNVSHKLVSRAEVTKMPTIQLWSDGKKQGEVVGGHSKAYLVVNEVRDMIENESSPL